MCLRNFHSPFVDALHMSCPMEYTSLWTRGDVGLFFPHMIYDRSLVKSGISRFSRSLGVGCHFISGDFSWNSAILLCIKLPTSFIASDKPNTYACITAVLMSRDMLKTIEDWYLYICVFICIWMYVCECVFIHVNYNILYLLIVSVLWILTFEQRMVIWSY